MFPAKSIASPCTVAGTPVGVTSVCPRELGSTRTTPLPLLTEVSP